jgi:hypothetical protein
MTRKKTLKDFSAEELAHELRERWADEHHRPGMTMSQMELLVWRTCGMETAAALQHLQALLARGPKEKPTAKPCPKCGKRAPLKAKERERTVRSIAGVLTLRRNYHHCEKCSVGFYPLDAALDLPPEGELTRQMEKRVLDFAVNDVFGQGAQRWAVHYATPISDNLLRRVAARVGAQAEAAEASHLQEELKPLSAQPAEVLVVQTDGSLLPIRGEEPWKEAKVGVVYRHDAQAGAPQPDTSRYVAVLGTVQNFAPLLEEALLAEAHEEVPCVVWLGDGAPHNWTLAEQLAPDALQVLDWYHAVLHAVEAGKVLLGEDSPYLHLWQQRSETLLAAGVVDALVAELMDCTVEVEKRRKGGHESLEALDALVRYYRSNAQRMDYQRLRAHGLPIGSGAVESAHRHVLQCRMKRAGQRWAYANARRMAHLRAAYRTAGACRFYDAIQAARRRTERGEPRRAGIRNGFRFARQGVRDRRRASI